MSTHKAGGTSSQHVSPAGKRLGFKVSSGEKVGMGEILVRQRGTRIAAGDGVKSGRDHTLYAVAKGTATVSLKQGKKVMSIAN